MTGPFSESTQSACVSRRQTSSPGRKPGGSTRDVQRAPEGRHDATFMSPAKSGLKKSILAPIPTACAVGYRSAAGFAGWLKSFPSRDLFAGNSHPSRIVSRTRRRIVQNATRHRCLTGRIKWNFAFATARHAIRTTRLEVTTGR